MDSLTQGLLGAATFAIIKDKEIGKKSLLIGAVAGTLPDLDVLLAPFFSDIEFLTIHRSVSHSIVLAIALSLILGEVFFRCYKRKQARRSWHIAFFLSIFTHSILDWFTTYGTKLISPFDDHLFSLNSIHVFEPIYTAILLSGICVHLIKSRKKIKSNAIKYSLIVSSCYLLVGMVSKNHAYYHFKTQLDKNNMAYEEILVSPTPLNILLWHGIVKQSDGYQFSTYSIFDRKKPIKFEFVKSNNDVIKEVAKERLIKYYLEYTQGFPLIQKDDDGNVEIYAIKYGPINYFGKPEFVYPLSFNLNNLSEEEIRIDSDSKHKGPVKNYKNLFKRIICQQQ
jgi:inner membrane protein